MNRLADSLSPYLLQHKDNPVDWFPWGEEAFEVAQQTDRPIFLSVGYAACHWCHVMEHESFEDQATAGFLNQHFVSIKVDREERPDIDQIYMNAVQVMTGRGGWPMSVFLDHDRRPFYAGTYWPPAPRFGMPGFMQVLDALADAWRQRREEVLQHCGEITDSLRQLAVGVSEASADDELPGDEVIEAATAKLVDVLDHRDGGFGAAPKFPHATDLALLLRRGPTHDDSALLDAAMLTLDHMAAGGIRDHIGGGFARYSVDAKWLVPHFEKMLYDNALLTEIYTRAFQVTGRDTYAEVARETLDYLAREMRDPAGGFHCSEDADSEGVEGKFYVWTPEEVQAVLGQERGDLFCQIYDITAAGNFEGASIPNLIDSPNVQDPLRAWAEELKIEPDELRKQLHDDRQQLRQARDRRVHPGRDDKVLTAWNALAIRAFAVASAVLDRPQDLETAATAAEFILSRLSRDDGRLLHAYRGGQSHLDAYVDDYAYTIEAFVALFEASGQPRWIEQAVRLAELMTEHFQDPRQGGFFYTADDAEQLITRQKDWHDGSLVSGTASAATALLKLSNLCARSDFRVAAENTFRLASELLTSQSAACGALLAALDLYHHGRHQLVIAVNDVAALQAMRSEIFRKYLPNTTLSWVVGSPADSQGVVKLNADRGPIDGQPTLYRCEEFTCERPLVGEKVFRSLRGDAG